MFKSIMSKIKQKFSKSNLIDKQPVLTEHFRSKINAVKMNELKIEMLREKGMI